MKLKQENTKRNLIQQNATNSIIDAKFRGILNIAFRVGKTKIVIDALNTIKSEIKVLVMAPQVPVLESWKQEILKWGLAETISITYCWSNSLKKDTNAYHLIIADECHAYNKSVLMHLRRHQIQGSRIVGLTGTLDQVSEFNLSNILSLKTVFSYSFAQAVEDKIIADYNVVCIGVELDDTEEIYSISKDLPLVTEKVAYEYWNKLYGKAVKNQKFESLKFYMMKRKDIIYGSKTKLAITKKLIEEQERCLIFSARQEIADELGDTQFHSKAKKGLELFKKGKKNKLSVISMVSTGVTLPNLKVGIFNQMKSVEALALQQTARMLNLEDGRPAKIWIVYLKGTQDETWVNLATEGFDKNKITWV